MAFWEHFTDEKLFCNTGCADHCRGDEFDESDEEFRATVYAVNEDESPVGRSLSTDEQLPCVNHPHACKGMTQFSLPWADLNGNQKESLVTRDASPIRSLLPLSNTSTGSSFNNLYRPIFVTGLPTRACQYLADPNDPIDGEVFRTLGELSPEAFRLFALRRVEAGKYEIEGRKVAVYQSARGLLVHENEVLGASVADMPLQAYINLVANVALDLQRLATDNSLTDNPIVDAGAPTITNCNDGDDRFRAMQIACMQAKIRGQDAERQWSVSLQGGLAGRPLLNLAPGS